jgi:hypothetical protein
MLRRPISWVFLVVVIAGTVVGLALTVESKPTPDPWSNTDAEVEQVRDLAQAFYQVMRDDPATQCPRRSITPWTSTEVESMTDFTVHPEALDAWNDVARAAHRMCQRAGL